MKQCKKILSAFLALAMLAGCIVAFSLTSGAVNGVDLPAEAEGKVYNGTPSTSLAGSGTEADPYLIQTAADLMYLLTICEYTHTATDDDPAITDRTEMTNRSTAPTQGKYYKLTADLYMNEKDAAKPISLTTPIKSSYNSKTKKTTYTFSRSFGGVLDGNGHTIYNLYCSGYSNGALFDTVTGTIKDLTIAGATIVATNNNAAGLAITASGATIENCHLIDAEISGQYVGGLVQGVASGAVVRDCTVSGKLTVSAGSGKSGTVGGVVGSIAASQSATLINCRNYATIDTTNKYGNAFSVGGIIGGTDTNSNAITELTLQSCENHGTIVQGSGKTNTGVGGIMGNAYRAKQLTFIDCVNDAPISGVYNVGGILGRANWAMSNSGVEIRLVGCRNESAVTATADYAGGLIGLHAEVMKGFYVIDCAVYGSVQAANYAGGIVGRNQTATYGSDQMVGLINSVVFAQVTATGNYAGLVAGSNSILSTGTMNVTNSVLTGSVTAAGNAAAVMGSVDSVKTGTTSNVNLTNAYVKATVIVAAEGTAATVAGGAGSTITMVNLDTADSAFDVAVTVGETVQSAPVTYYITETEEGTENTVTAGQTVTLPAMSPTALTDGSAVTALNDYASTNGYTLWAQGTSYPEFAQMKLDGATLNLGAEMTMKFLLKADSLAGLTKYLKDLYVTVDGTTRYAGVLNSQTGNYEFEVNDLAARDFAKEAVYKLQYTTQQNKETIVTCTDGISYSPLTYATRMYNANKDDSTKTDFTNLLVALVQYTAAAAGDPTVAANFATATGYVFPEAGYGNYAAIVAKDGASTFTYAENASGIAEMGASLTGSLNLILTPKKASYTAVTAKIGEAELEVVKSGGTWVIKGLYASELYDTITFTFTGDGVDTVTATYSVARFLSNYVGTDYAALAQATAIYMDAANTYARGN